MTSRIVPLQRGYFKSDRHKALADEHTAHLHPDPHAPWRIPAPKREPIRSVEDEYPLLWLVYALGVCSGIGGSAIWRYFA